MDETTNETLTADDLRTLDSALSYFAEEFRRTDKGADGPGHDRAAEIDRLAGKLLHPGRTWQAVAPTPGGGVRA